MKKGLKLLLLAFMCILLVGFGNAQTVSAAKKAELDCSSLTITMGKNEYDGIEYYLYNMVDDAKYTYESSDKSIVTVDKNGYLTGESKGTAEVTVYQTYKKKKTEIGKVTVTVKGAYIDPYIQRYGLKLYYETEENLKEKTKEDYGYNSTNLLYQEILCYQNNDATYSFTSTDETKVKIDKKGNIVYISNPGVSVTIDVNETYKKKTEKIGSFTFRCHKAYIDAEEYTVYKNHNFNAGTDVIGTDSYYVIVSDKKDINDVNLKDLKEVSSGKASVDKNDVLIWDNSCNNEWSCYFIGNKEGTAYIHYLFGTKPIKENYFGTVKVNVSSAKTSDFDIYSYYMNKDSITYDVYSDDLGRDDVCAASLSIVLDPWNGSELPEVKVSDEKIATAKIVEDSYGLNVYFYVKKAGTIKLTLTLGDKKIEKEITFTEYSYDDYYYDDYYYDDEW